jgi:hypothetical protein
MFCARTGTLLALTSLTARSLAGAVKRRFVVMDIKIIILTALIGVIAAFSHIEQTAAQRKRPHDKDREVLPI